MNNPSEILTAKARRRASMTSSCMNSQGVFFLFSKFAEKTNFVLDLTSKTYPPSSVFAGTGKGEKEDRTKWKDVLCNIIRLL